MASDGPSPLPPSLRLDLLAHQPSKRHHAQSLRAPSFYDLTWRTPHVLESHPERAVPLFRRNKEWRNAVSSPGHRDSAFALHLYLVACNPSSSCCFWVLDHLCSNLNQVRAIVILFHVCWITETHSSFNLCVCVYLFRSDSNITFNSV